jgi:hypothetical protein
MFVLCTQVSLKEIKLSNELEKQQALLKSKGITLLPWGRDELSLKLKNYPGLVDDFFGRGWVKVFCGPDQAERLGRRLDAIDVIKLRHEYRKFYQSVFNHHDPGLPLTEVAWIVKTEICDI